MKIQLLLPLCFAIFSCNSQNKKIPTDNPMKTELDKLVQKEASVYMENPARVGISIGIFKDGKSYFYNYGTTELGKSELPTSKSVYEIASITKTFTGTLLAHALVDGKIKPDDDIRKYLDGNYPNLEFEKHSITVAHLTNHSSGLPQFLPDQSETFKKPMDSVALILSDFYKNYSKKKFYEDLHQAKLAFVPGTDYKYSNVATQIAGDILEKVYHKSYEDLLSEYITKPLNMSRTIVGTDSSKLLTCYNEKGKVMPRNITTIMAPTGGILSTTEDLVKYMQYHLNEKDKYVKASHTPTVKGEGDQIGLYWRLNNYDDGTKTIYHTGGTFGFSSVLQIYPSKNMGIVVLSNESDAESQGKLQDIADGILRNNSKK
ncbi:D-alanyl-D-alanine-carboxypeptidase/D-alanyl-D-alanine-endopeptidase [Chryseobacterium ginsenosidimutans]|uniref:serine hydrolase domain-containing protein n=1 Tax=Chryseobacterium ginsenosidimutans TaxID=687846 RepID=UPI0027848EA6|nr:serine hydrolase domain-containing protein [Chryseobacterium ginsenosidimutans]MDQ0593215.1 D-alanyl-D-alanine-carboxypeptidase/D-alanyl-D-alanine-endopeptidase [Chryseobacterium ginsenosidimutans]